jgi:hypothetical protein
MKMLYYCFAGVLFLTGCRKEKTVVPPVVRPTPAMQYFDLTGRETTYNSSQHIDLDQDGTRDFSFVTYHLGDPVLNQDVILFCATSPANRLLLVNEQDESPVFNKASEITVTGKPGYTWYEVSVATLSKKIIQSDKAPYWIGTWSNVTKKYLGIRVLKNGLFYNGWFELSMDTVNEKIILYRAGLCKEADKTILAGE